MLKPYCWTFGEIYFLLEQWTDDHYHYTGFRGRPHAQNYVQGPTWPHIHFSYDVPNFIWYKIPSLIYYLLIHFICHKL